MTDTENLEHEPQAIDIKALEREGDFAADYIEGLLDIADMDGDIDIDVKNGRAYVSVAGGDSRLDLLSNPESVQALQELSRLAAQTKSGQHSGLILDIAGSRDARTDELKQIVEAAIVAIIAGRDEVVLEPMSSYERKIVHDFVSEKNYCSESRGEGRDRRLVISAAK